ALTARAAARDPEADHLRRAERIPGPATAVCGGPERVWSVRVQPGVGGKGVEVRGPRTRRCARSTERVAAVGPRRRLRPALPGPLRPDAGHGVPPDRSQPGGAGPVPGGVLPRLAAVEPHRDLRRPTGLDPQGGHPPGLLPLAAAGGRATLRPPTPPPPAAHPRPGTRPRRGGGRAAHPATG